MYSAQTSIPANAGRARKPWVAPRVDSLPRLTNLTLNTHTGDPIDGGGDVNNPGGSVFT